ncbi:hypothetical protein SATRM34S_00568 [Streptomyces atroolivaceus]
MARPAVRTVLLQVGLRFGPGRRRPGPRPSPENRAQALRRESLLFQVTAVPRTPPDVLDAIDEIVAPGAVNPVDNSYGDFELRADQRRR